MANYDDVWGESHKSSSWVTISIPDKHISNACGVIAWMGMISFFTFGIFTLVARSDPAALLMLFSLLVWIAAGIVVIRVRRKGRKILRLTK